MTIRAEIDILSSFLTKFMRFSLFLNILSRFPSKKCHFNASLGLLSFKKVIFDSKFTKNRTKLVIMTMIIMWLSLVQV